MARRAIFITETDARRLRGLLAGRAKSIHDQEHLQELKEELERAQVLDPDEVPAEVVTVNSRVQVRDLTNQQLQEFTLVFPAEADVARRRISVLAPLGTALLGYREGDEVEWDMPGGRRRLRIERVTPAAEAEPNGASRQPESVVLPAGTG